MLALLLAAASCGEVEPTARYDEPVARVAGRMLDASVVRMIAARDQVPEAEAHERALETLRLAAAHEEAARAEAAEAVVMDPARARHLLRSARARLWLEKDFEPKHTPRDIPEPLIKQNLDKRSIFHPEVHALCYAIVMPAEVDDATGRNVVAPADEAWWKRAEAHLAPIEERLRRYIPDPGQEPGCEFFGKVARFAEGEGDEDLHLKIEQGGFVVCAKDMWDPGFVDALCDKYSEPAWVEPFRTQYGLHLVAIVHIDPANEPDLAGKETYLRERMHGVWQQQAFGEYMKRLRARRTVRLGPALRAAEPTPSTGQP